MEAGWSAGKEAIIGRDMARTATSKQRAVTVWNGGTQDKGRDGRRVWSVGMEAGWSAGKEANIGRDMARTATSKQRAITVWRVGMECRI